MDANINWMPMDRARAPKKTVPLEVYQLTSTALSLALFLIFGSDVQDPLTALDMLGSIIPTPAFDGEFEGMYADLRTLAQRLDDDDSPETVRWGKRE